DVARINASFADHAELKRVSSDIRNISKDIALMMDTKGHKIRISDFKKSIQLKKGQKFSVFCNKVSKGVYLVTDANFGLETQIPKDTILLVDDGLIQLKVRQVKPDVSGVELVCEVIQGGELKRSKTVNIPGVHLDFPELAKKDYEDIMYAKKLKFDFIAASFVRNTDDIRAIRKLVDGSNTKIIAKIEDAEGAANFDGILKEVDGIMIARGDLGIEMPTEKVPVLQKKFIEKCNAVGKPVIVATQMLQSMIENIFPTRAEVSDVANAIFDGTDAVMLSAETCTGKFPVETVGTMAKIAKEVELSVDPVEMKPTTLAKPTTNAIARAVIDSCQSLPIDKILVATASGTTAITISRFRPKQPIYAFTQGGASKRKLALTRGIIPSTLQKSASARDKGVQSLVRTAKDQGFVSDSDLVVVVAGSNIMGQGQTNLMEINRVEHIVH
ncbi:MAG: pyruvate kinase, partial [Patescibacteria group bacterium]|nr:pyruvate kinase [Patescibacteria group bacterium]